MGYSQSLRPGGMSLVEVLIALSLFALLSLLGMRAITSLEKQGGRLDLHQSQLADLSQALMLFESDLSNARVLSMHLGQAVSIRVAPDRTEFEMAAAPERVGSSIRFVRWVLDGRTVRRYPDRAVESIFFEWSGVIAAIRLEAIQDDRRVEWSNITLSQPIQAVEFRFRLQDNAELSRLLAVGRRSL